MRPPFNGTYGINAGWRYSSGTGHFAYDYDCPTGTPMYAVGGGTILASNDGVSNDTPGDADYGGEPSNWILLGTRWKGEKVSVLYQHLSPGLKVKPGHKVAEGHLLGRSGDSGNSSGPHLHFAAMRGWWAEATRYIYMTNDGDNPYVIFPPDRLWKGEDMPLSDQEKRDIADRTVDMLLRRRLFPNTDRKDLKDVRVIHSLRRSYLGHDEPAEVQERKRDPEVD